MEYETHQVAAVPPAAWRRALPWARTLAQLVLAGALLAVLLWRVDVSSVREELADASLWWLPLAFGANLVSDWFRAIRWQQFFASMQHVPVPFLFGVAVLGVACNQALPLRAGEVVRVQLLRRRTGLRVAQIVATILSEKLADIIAYSTFILVGIALYEDAHFLWPIAVAYGIVLPLGIIAARQAAAWAAENPEPLSQPEGHWRTRVMQQLHWLGLGLQSFRSPWAMFRIVWTSHAAWLCEATMYYACGRALGIDLDPAVYLLVVVAATIAVSVPITIAGLGVFEIAITGLLVAFGLSEEQAAAYAIFSHIALALPYLVSGPLAALVLRASVTDILFLRAPKKEPEAATPAGA